MYENYAERLFVDLKNAQIKIEVPQYVQEGAKIGMFPNTEQLVIFGNNGKYNFGKGPGINDNWSKTFTEAYSECLEYIVKNFGSTIKFYSLVIPRKAVVDVKLLEFETVVSRYIKDYLHQCDLSVERWDIMIQKVNSNA